MFMITSCSKEQKHDVLSFFFDGVPNPRKQDSLKVDTTKLDSSLVTKHEESILTKQYLHAPFETQSCGDCHNTAKGYSLIAKGSALCYNCHPDFRENLKILHGPVANGECIQCHQPHSSPYQRLLSRKGQDLCLYCHKRNDINLTELHKAIEKKDCWECHNPHGGADRTFLNKN